MMKSKIVVTGLLVGCLLQGTNIVFGQSVSTVDESLATYIDIQNKRIGFNGIVLVSNETDIISQQVIGLASHELNLPLSYSSKFKVASITKAFTGLLIALAEQEGKLHHNTCLETYFPELHDEKWKQITILQLISHTSGIPHWAGLEDYWIKKSRLSLNREQMLEEIFNMKLLFEPGTQSAYSSPAYYLLATILEKIYTDTYDNLLNEKILLPLQLKETGAFDQLEIIPEMSNGYHMISDDSLIVAPYRDISSMFGGGNLYSTAQDLLIWCRSFMSQNIWGEHLVETTFKPLTTIPRNHKGSALYGMGWHIKEGNNNELKTYHIGGGTFGFSSKIAIYPEEKICIIILANVSFLPINDVIWKDVEKIVFGKPFEFPKEYVKPVQLSVKEFKNFEGVYTTTKDIKLNIFIHEDKLFARLGRNPPFEIYAKSQNEFFSKKIDIQFTFVLNENGRVTALKTEGRGRVDRFEKQQ